MLNELKPVEGARKPRKRLGRGTGSGTGKTAGKGHKGQNARSGGGVRPGFEGGQLPLFQRIPKRGFNNVNRKEYSIVNIADLNQFDDGTEITPEFLLEKKIIRKLLDGLKVLGNGELSKKLSIECHKISDSAKSAVESAGGSVSIIEGPKKFVRESKNKNNKE